MMETENSLIHNSSPPAELREGMIMAVEARHVFFSYRSTAYFYSKAASDDW